MDQRAQGRAEEIPTSLPSTELLYAGVRRYLGNELPCPLTSFEPKYHPIERRHHKATWTSNQTDFMPLAPVLPELSQTRANPLLLYSLAVAWLAL